MVKKYKNEGLMKFLTVIGGLVALASQIFALLNYTWPLGRYVGFYDPVYAIIGIIISIITIYTAINPNNPFPFHWLFLFVLGILLVVFAGGIVACALLIIAALIGLIEAL
ncbi:MAG: hypothetical protein JSV62_12425 [Promethearchaeota archaeon]|nr:MAG: hypothetical protein JSV62_12425 [Candidatus Lokiarchaeota archaeon]